MTKDIALYIHLEKSKRKKSNKTKTIKRRNSLDYKTTINDSYLLFSNSETERMNVEMAEEYEIELAIELEIKESREEEKRRLKRYQYFIRLRRYRPKKKPKLTIRQKKLNKFRHLYFRLKLKKKFMKFLWEKVREPKAREKFSPANLIKLLGDKDEDNLDTVLESWK